MGYTNTALEKKGLRSHSGPSSLILPHLKTCTIRRWSLKSEADSEREQTFALSSLEGAPEKLLLPEAWQC